MTNEAILIGDDWTYTYSPYTAQDGNEIPAFEVHGAGDKICDTNENLSRGEQEAFAKIITAAPQMAAALVMAIHALNTAPRFKVPVLNSDSYKIVSVCERSIANLTTARRDQTLSARPFHLPPDPEGRNDDRARWADAAVEQFRKLTGTDHDDALGDLLCDLMHWADRANFDFDRALERARGHYGEETTASEGGVR